MQDRCLDRRPNLLQRVGGVLLVDRLEHRLPFVGAQLLHDVREVGGMDLPEPVVRDQQPQAPLRIGFDDVAGIPGNRVGRYLVLDLADGPVRKKALGQAPKGTLKTHTDLVDPQLLVAVDRDAQSQVIDPDDLASVDIDNLLVEQILGEQQVVIVAVVGCDVLVRQADAIVLER